MIQIIWSSIFAPVSVLLSDNSSKHHIEKVVQCGKLSIILSNVIGLNDVRDVFISMLAKGVQFSSHNELKLKNVLCIKALIEIALEKKSNMGKGWRYIFEA